MESSSKHLSSPPASPVPKKHKVREPLADITNAFGVEEATHEAKRKTCEAEEAPPEIEEKIFEEEQTVLVAVEKTSGAGDATPNNKDKTSKAQEVSETLIYARPSVLPPSDGPVLSDIRQGLQKLYTYEAGWLNQLQTTAYYLRKSLRLPRYKKLPDNISDTLDLLDTVRFQFFQIIWDCLALLQKTEQDGTVMPLDQALVVEAVCSDLAYVKTRWGSWKQRNRADKMRDDTWLRDVRRFAAQMKTRCSEAAEKLREVKMEKKKQNLFQRELDEFEPGGEEWRNYLEERYQKFKEDPWSQGVVKWVVNDQGVTGVEI